MLPDRRGASEPDLLDRHATADALGITVRQLVKLARNPTFPKPIHKDRFTVYRARDEIEAFRQEMKEVRARGWKVPEALYPWEVDFPVSWYYRKAARWERSNQ